MSRENLIREFPTWSGNTTEDGWRLHNSDFKNLENSIINFFKGTKNKGDDHQPAR